MADCGYSFKKEAKVYIVDLVSEERHRIDISEITFSQTFTEYSYSTKSIQNPYMFEQSIINKANPANFTLTFPAIKEDDFEVLFNKALDYTTFDLFVETATEIFKVETCVITNTSFILEKTRPLSVGITGEASRVTRFGDIGTDIDASYLPIVITPIARSGTMTYNRISDLEVTLGGSTVLSDYLASISIELQNEVTWTPYTTVNDALIAVDANSSMYPTSFTISKRILAGTIVNYLTDTNNANLLQWDTSTSLHIFAGQSTYGFDIDMTYCSFTNRVGSESVFTQSYDWRITQNPGNLSDIITYVTLP